MSRTVVVNRGPNLFAILAAVIALLNIAGAISVSWWWVVLLALLA